MLPLSATLISVLLCAEPASGQEAVIDLSGVLVCVDPPVPPTRTCEVVRVATSYQPEVAPPLVWRAYCKGCHGSSARADTPLGRSKGAPDMSAPSFQCSRTDAMLERAILQGVPPKMKAYAGRLSPEDVAEIVRFIRAVGAVKDSAAIDRRQDDPAAFADTDSRVVAGRCVRAPHPANADAEAQEQLRTARVAFARGELDASNLALKRAQALGWNDLDLTNALRVAGLRTSGQNLSAERCRLQ
ncbi:MAG: c-type cytochrome [Myxococcaceae bacterium]